ncbi:hypothetical protein Godav_001551 [Gossypium davidsonii]|uniref:Uncharacterized protein n=1 Tax=Gossypium davidsonii TaxID=34287 RepID=A0A7J8T574_GOSDV|nr:hypothetical protein [Gossypium davidsonii]
MIFSHWHYTLIIRSLDEH